MCPMLDQIKFECMHGMTPPRRRLEVGKLTSYVLNQAWSRVWFLVCTVVGGPSKLCIWDLNTSCTIVPIHIFGKHAVYTGSSDRPRLPCAVFWRHGPVRHTAKLVKVFAMSRLDFGQGVWKGDSYRQSALIPTCDAPDSIVH